MQQIQVAGMAWFAEDDYDSFRRLLPERSWHPTFALWRQAAEENLKRLESKGYVTVKADVRSDTFADWCRSRGLDIDTRALTAYANEAAVRTLEGAEVD